MTKAPVGTVVYAKKHALQFRDREELPHIIVAHVRKRSGMIAAKLETGDTVSFGELTDIPCSTMECGNCKWHRKET